ncbi:hypothetical protein Q7C_691 [Methylophaga frappieri]|uniref:Uncharacterized protein n=1 Tax=Methylophaga frappieri (strain ATCC BAA-2434 / DSM 25690 / JAM7) TaxID=754477 RepID=I1YG19_METFJ|nr:hypothetical protein [Methylophaga frappieri]AFJ01862.1 hypothetical protein Q7C_691 [Methylophaga frappieri]
MTFRQGSALRHLYLLATLLLLMQSFALWHDSVHLFHTHETQCERLEAVTHLPAIDAVTLVQSYPPVERLLLATPVLAFQQISTLQDAQSIRGPPAHLS